MFLNASSKVRGSSRSINRDAPNLPASSSRIAFLRVPTERFASLLLKCLATSFPTCPVAPNTSRLLELFMRNLRGGSALQAVPLPKAQDVPFLRILAHRLAIHW